MFDSRDRFKCFAKKDLDKAIKSFQDIKTISESKDKSLGFNILVSGGIKEEGKIFDYRLSDNAEDAFNDYLYYDLYSYLSKKKGHLIWRARPTVKQLDDGKFIIYSRLIIIN